MLHFLLVTAKLTNIFLKDENWKNTIKERQGRM